MQTNCITLSDICCPTGKKSKNNSNVPKQEKFHHSVYVILLDAAVLKHRSVLHQNPKRDPSKPCVYVGMTGLPVEAPFRESQARLQILVGG